MPHARLAPDPRGMMPADDLNRIGRAVQRLGRIPSLRCQACRRGVRGGIRTLRCWTSLVPAISRLGDRRVWWSQTGSNRRPPACKAGALPTELWPLGQDMFCRDMFAGRPAVAAALPRRMLMAERPTTLEVVGLERFELSTSRLSSARSNQLSYRPGKRGGRPNEERETKAAVSRKKSPKLALHWAPCVSKHRERANPRWVQTSYFLASLERR